MSLRKVSTILALVITCALLLSYAPRPIRAAPGVVNLELGGPGSVAWNIPTVKPGDSGVKLVTLHNSGDTAGSVTIWLSGVVNNENGSSEAETGNTAEPGELGDHLLVKVSGGGITSNLSFPVLFNSFPQSSSSDSYVRINSLNAGQTLTISWEWQLPLVTDNDVQGDSVSFLINYLLEELPPDSGGGDGGGAPAPVPAEPGSVLEITTPEGSVKLPVSGEGNVASSTVVPLMGGGLILGIDAGTLAVSDDGRVAKRLVVNLAPEIPPLLEGYVILSPAYEISAVVSGEVRQVSFDPPVTLTVKYDPSKLPENVAGVFIAYFDPNTKSWVQLQPPEGYTSDPGENSGLVSLLGKYAVYVAIARLALKALVSARFVLNGLIVYPPVIKSGEEARVSVFVKNTGGLNGDYLLKLNIKDLFSTSRLVRVAAGEERQVDFSVTAAEPGIYGVSVGDLTGYFTVEVEPQELGRFNLWWLALAGVITILFFIWLFTKGRGGGKSQVPVSPG